MTPVPTPRASGPGMTVTRSTRRAEPTPVHVEPRAATGACPMPDLDPMIHERLRLGIVSALAVNASLSFIELRGLLATTDGNLSAHARKLEEAGYLRCTKSFDGRVPRTDFDLTERGRGAFETYLTSMEDLIARTRRP